MIACPVCQEVPEDWNVMWDMRRTPGVVCGCGRMRVTRKFLALHDTPYSDHRDPDPDRVPTVGIVLDEDGPMWYVTGECEAWARGPDATGALCTLLERTVVSGVMVS